jgi:APA family basic amino acid/polyamine antiporter
MSKDGLERKLGLFSTTNIVIANMIGTGIFTTSGLLLNIIPNPKIMVLLWLLGGTIALCGALSYSTLGSKFPMAGGEYLYLSKLFHPILGFLSGWISLFAGFSAPISASAIGFTEYLSRAFPEILKLGILNSSMEEIFLKKFYSILIILVFTFIHLRGISFGAKVQNFLTILKIVFIIFFIGAGFLSKRGDFSHFSTSIPLSFNLTTLKAIGLSLMWIMFSYSGWNASSYIGSEIKNPSRNIPLSLFLGTFTVSFVYFLINVVYIYAIPPDEMKGVVSVAGLAMKKLFGDQFELVSSLLTSFVLFSSLSAFIILGPRVYYAMAKDGCFFKFASDIHPLFKVPSNSIILQGIISIIILISGTFEEILTYMSFSLGVFPLIAIFGIFKIRAKDKNHKIFLFPLPQLFYILFSLSILTFGFLERPIPSSVAILTIFTGIPFYFLFKRKSKACK